MGVDNKYKYSALTSKIIGCAIEVHKHLRNGFQEVIIQLAEVHLAQAINYLEAYKMDVGLLINFGGKSLDFKRVMNKKSKSS